MLKLKMMTNLSVEAVIGSIDGKCIIRDKIIGSRANAKTLGKDLAENFWQMAD